MAPDIIWNSSTETYLVLRGEDQGSHGQKYHGIGREADHEERARMPDDHQPGLGWIWIGTSDRYHR